MLESKVEEKLEEYWNDLGPGLVTGAADDDPSGIATYSQTGAQYGFRWLWLAPLTFPLMAVVQEMCARIGLVTGRGLAANIRSNYSRPVLYVCTILLLAANVLNIGADLGAMAAAAQLLLPGFGSIRLVILFTIVSLLLQIFIPYQRYAKYLKYLTIVLASYVVAAFAIHVPWGDVLRHTFLPSISFSKSSLFLLCAVLGTTISPYLFFWQTSQEVEEEIAKGDTTVQKRRAGVQPSIITRMRKDVWVGMFVSNLVMFFIILTTGATLYTQGITITSAADAAAALQPLGGEWAFVLFTVGIIGTGLLAIPILAGSASYAISESFGWKYGLYRKFRQAHAFYGVIILAMLLGLIINVLRLDPIQVLLYSAVANGLIAPLILFFILRLSSNKKLMGPYANSNLSAGLGWTITILMTVTGIALVAAFLWG